MILRVLAVLVASILCLSAPAISAEMSLADAVAYALGHSTGVATERAAVAQARAQYVRAHAQELPNINATLQNQQSKSSNYGGSFGLIGANQANVFSQNTAQIGTQYELFNGGLNRILAQVDKQQLDEAQAALRRTQDQVATDVTAQYFAIASADEQTRLDRSDVAYQQALVRVAQAKVGAGVAAGVDLLRAQTQERQSESTLVGAAADAQNARDLLAQLIGAPMDTAFSVPAEVAAPPLPAQPLDSLVAIAQSHRPEVASAGEAVTVARLNRRAADTDLLPNIALNAAFGNQFSPTLYVAQRNQIMAQNQAIAANNALNARLGLPPQPLLGLPARGSPGFWTIGANTSLTLPLVDYGTRRANHRGVDAQIESATTNLSSQNNQVALDVRQSLRNAEAAQAQIQFARDEVRLGVESARIAQLQYQSGINTLTDVQSAEKTALSAQTDLFNARVRYADAVVKLRVALGIYDPQSAVADIR
ncbi:MAG: TolC family protein [Candidatus Eremiobacteraeota bacterium]|nr:TolC family protein [Candidatus Eremiobacteraeota bacterium]